MKKYLFFIITLIFISCDEDKPIEAGIETRVSGHINDIFDAATPIENFKIKLGEYRRDFSFDGGAYDVFIKFIDSTITNNEGYYDLTFTTTGNGSRYKIHCEQTDQVWTIYQDPVLITNIGGENQIDFGFIHLYPVDLRITLTDVDNLPIQISGQLHPFSLGRLDENNIEYIRRIYVSKLEGQEIRFYKTLADGTVQIAQFSFPATNSTILTEFNINLTNADFN
ncbi:MAG TPA: hypothetical protein P5335_11730 [Flavobacterium sp.]|nr:hypothetical protein [Flavobacterium sp.]HRZ75595.1 hypothetical protein [Flavobacterium sp.]